MNFKVVLSVIIIFTSPLTFAQKYIGDFLNPHDVHIQLIEDKDDINIIKGAINTNTQNISDIQASISDNSVIIGRHDLKIIGLTNDFGKYKGFISNNEDSIASNESKINQHKVDIETNATNINKNRHDINTTKDLVIANRQGIAHLHNQTQFLEKATTKKFAAMDITIGDNHHHAMAGISSAMAMSAIPFVEGDHFSIGFGSGSYGGQGAAAMGAKFKVSQHVNASLTASYDTTGHVGSSAGISYGW